MKDRDNQAPPRQGAWCWVTDGTSVWPARYDPSRAGGWTNDDTWEDFDSRVIAWVEIDKPRPPQFVRVTREYVDDRISKAIADMV